MSREKNHFLTFMGLALGLCLSQQAFARDDIYQNADTRNQMQVQVENKSREVQPVWVLFYFDEFVQENYFEVPARSIKTLSLDGIKNPAWSFALLTKSALVRPVGTSQADVWDKSSTSRFEMKLKNSQPMALHYFNLYLEKQKVSLNYYDTNGKILSQNIFTTASFRRSLSRMETPPEGAKLLVIETEAPLQVISPSIVKPVTDTRRIATQADHYFLVQNGVGGTTFVAPTSDPEIIQKAREEILNPQGYMVFADIELNPLQPNRDFSKPEKTYWSWSVKKITGLAQIGGDWCQAYPEMIERMLHQFIRQGQVCFRGQKIIRELKPAEVQSGVLNNP